MKLNPLWKLLHAAFPRVQPWHHCYSCSTLMICQTPLRSFLLARIKLFADDTNIFFTSNNAKEVEFTMNKELKLVLKYCTISKLSVNLKKTNN